MTPDCCADASRTSDTEMPDTVVLVVPPLDLPSEADGAEGVPPCPVWMAEPEAELVAPLLALLSEVDGARPGTD